ncbi:hypothetical protein [Nocardioides sp.]|uniref:hypothetical protein n=1 Tax=Nocardioides sp. TaxID=35761 RepID=UPI0037837401
MAEPHQTSDGAAGWLTPTAAGIAGLTIGALGLLGNGTWLLVVQGWLNRNGSSALSDTVMLSALATGAVAAVALVLGTRALGSSVPVARDLGGAAVVVSGLALLLAALAFLVGIVTA